ncbi:MAG: cytochrome c oxidase subunit 3 [Alphaproteobacteria bacterium]
MAHHDHDFFIPNPSIWPPLSCLGMGLMAVGMLLMWHMLPVLVGQATFAAGILLVVTSASQWWASLIAEARARGYKNPAEVVDLGNRYGMIFFIVSEIMFFAAFFAAYFYLRGYNPVWPPANIEALTIDLPAINTLLLLTSGATITWAHHALLNGRRDTAIMATTLTWQLGVIFLACQMFEYHHASYTISSGVYGSTFYMLTGFHGFHVLVGSIMLMLLTRRLMKGDFSPQHHFYFEATAWYWHFVDVVWIGLFLFVYVL